MKRADIPADVELRIRSAARHHCGYCLSPQRLVMARLEIEHIIPLARGGSDDESNLWFACPICNGHKSAKVDAIDPASGGRVSIFNPRTQVWYEHFAWTDDGLRIEGLTPIGRATVVALHLSDDPDAITVRSYWVLEAGILRPIDPIQRGSSGEPTLRLARERTSEVWSFS